jgi:hypothetical protein
MPPVAPLGLGDPAAKSEVGGHDDPHPDQADDDQGDADAPQHPGLTARPSSAWRSTTP